MSQRTYITIKKNDSYLSRNGLGDTIFCLSFKLPPQRFALDRCNQCSWRWNLHVEQFMFVINRSTRHFSILKRGEMLKMEGFLSTAHDKMPCINKHFYWLCAYYPFSTLISNEDKWKTSKFYVIKQTWKDIYYHTSTKG